MTTTFLAIAVVYLIATTVSMQYMYKIHSQWLDHKWMPELPNAAGFWLVAFMTPAILLYEGFAILTDIITP